MYCVKCGVELADTEKVCPLCGTAVYHPDISRPQVPPTYPSFVKEKENMRPQGILFILTVLAMMPIAITLFCDLHMNRAVTWSGYAVGGILVAYFVLVLPLWFSRPNPVVFLPIDFALFGVLLLYINWYTCGDWFLTLAFPAVGCMGLIVTALVTLVRYLRKGLLYVFGGGFVAVGGYCLLLEFFINLTFMDNFKFIWSPYPLIFCLFAGVALIVVGSSKSLRESLHRKIFI
jgi:hypothetical protein